ncbi:MAG: type II toxin-antitoxin system HicA family toxin [Chloroflexi bacterium]|nr:type II toxin-antitoxin system HicA family toxin [Chloroflexota bacterium]
MSRLTPLKPEEVVRKLRRLGFVGPLPGGKHPRMADPRTRTIIPVPFHGGRDVSVGLIRAIVRDLGLTPEEWQEL